MQSQRVGCVRWRYVVPVCVLFMFSTVGIVVIPSKCAITDHSQSGKDIDPLFLAASLWRTRVTKSRHSFYWMGWVNPKSECMTEINFWYWWDSNPPPLYKQLSVLPLDHHQCSMTRCSLSTIKLLPIIQFHLPKQSKIFTTNILCCCELMIKTGKQNN